MEIFSWIMSAVALTGTIINSKRNKYGFIAWIASNIWMSFTSFQAKLYPQSVLFFIYLILAIYGLWKWNKLENKEKLDETKCCKTIKAETKCCKTIKAETKRKEIK